MKRILHLALIGIGIASQPLNAGSDTTWTSAKETLGYFAESINRADGGIKFKARSYGQRYLYSVDGKQKEVIAYNQEIFVPTGSSLELTGKHASVTIQTIKDGTSVVVLAELQIDDRSFGKDVSTSRAATTIDSENKQIDLERAKADVLFQSSKLFTPAVPSTAAPSGQDPK